MTAPLTPGDLERLERNATEPRYRESEHEDLRAYYVLPKREEVVALLVHVRSLTERAEAAEGELDDLSTLVHYDGGDARGHLGECFSSVMDQWRHGRAAVKALLAATTPKAKAQAACDLYGAMFPDETDEDAPTEPDYEELVEAEEDRDALAERLVSLTAERDDARAERDAASSNACRARAERDAALSRLSRAREALDRYDEEPPHYRAGLDEENAWRARQEAALAALRAALTEETTPRE